MVPPESYDPISWAWLCWADADRQVGARHWTLASGRN